MRGCGYEIGWFVGKEKIRGGDGRRRFRDKRYFFVLVAKKSVFLQRQLMKHYDVSFVKY